MKTLPEFESWLLDIITNNRQDQMMPFVWELMKSPYVELHYNLLKDPATNREFKRSLSARFNEHGEDGELFLLSKLEKREDPSFHGEILFQLGRLKGRHKDKSLTFARELVESKDDQTREKALIVLGWLGSFDDAPVLERHLMGDRHVPCRAWSASSFMQIWFRDPSDELRVRAFAAFREALTREADAFVLSTIIVALREIGKTTLGISQKALDQAEESKMEAAKKRALNYLDKFVS